MMQFEPGMRRWRQILLVDVLWDMRREFEREFEETLQEIWDSQENMLGYI